MRFLIGGTLLLLWASAALSSSASAAPPEFLLRLPQAEELAKGGEGAGATNNPRGIAVSPDTGHVYVSDLVGSRINEYTAWGFFVRSWGWDVAPEGAPGDTPSDELEACGPVTPEEVPASGVCQAGNAGAGRGQLNWPMGLAVDPSGNVYVFERNNRRVQKFDPAGQFLVMFGGDVNRTKVEGGAPAVQRNRCPINPGDVCQAGIAGEGASQLDAMIGDFIAYSPTAGGTIRVGDKGGIQVFDLEGNWVETIGFEGALTALAGKQVNGLDIDKDQNIYITLNGTEDVFKLSSAGEPLVPGKPGASSFKAEEPLGVAVDVEGNVYAIDDPEDFSGPPPRILKYSAAGGRLVPTVEEEDAGVLFPNRPLGARLTAIAANICDGSEEPGNLYVGVFDAGLASYVDTFGTAPIGCEPPPPAVPILGEQFATFVGREEATVRASINPRFWPDVTYHVEYGTDNCSVGECPNKVPVPPALLTKRSVNAFLPTAGVLLEGLTPATTYHYRFVAQSSGGGPVHGIDPDGAGPLEADFENGAAATFRTHADEPPPPDCENDAFRIGPELDLPDCRAYEMVSPLDKGNADVALGIGRNNIRYRLYEINKSSLSAQRFTFSAATAFGDTKSAPFSPQYLATRESTGWRSEGISAPRTESPITVTLTFGTEFQGFSGDLCLGWLRHLSTAPIAPGAVAKYPNLYRRDNCDTPPVFSALTTVEPPTRLPEEYSRLYINGFSDDGSHTIFTAPDKLHPDAPVPNTGEFLLYEHTPEGLRFVCYLPNGDPIAEGCSAGTRAMPGVSSFSSLHNAISRDGSRIFWTASSGVAESNPGRIFVRIDAQETIAISEAVSSDPAFFWSAADDGSRAIFSFTAGPHKGELYDFDVDAKTATLIAKGIRGPMGASEDASRIYFASTEDLDEAGPAVAGQRNLYFYEANQAGKPGGVQFIMALAVKDLAALDPTMPGASQGAAVYPVNFLPPMRAARITPDGLHATFMSAVNPVPTGYDNRDIATGKAVPEVYRYDAVADELRCVSCNPTGARPVAGFVDEGIFAAARIQGWEANHHRPRVISDDGTRVFFESFEALVPRDTNSTWDVYQWEEAGKGGVGGCTEQRATYSEDSGGCIDLISSGQSQARSLFYDADPSGDNIFFGTLSSLVGPDYGLNDVYVARALGGFPEPLEEDECEGEACQSPPPPPPEVTPSTELSSGPGNEPATKQRQARKCPKGKRRIKRAGKVRCVKRKANKTRRAQR